MKQNFFLKKIRMVLETLVFQTMIKTLTLPFLPVSQLNFIKTLKTSYPKHNYAYPKLKTW